MRCPASAVFIGLLAAACSDGALPLGPTGLADAAPGQETLDAGPTPGPDAGPGETPVDAGLPNPFPDGPSLASGNSHTCARTAEGTVQCWGNNVSGALGDGTTEPRSNGVTVPGLTQVVEVRAGVVHTCVRLSDATVRCWGRNDFGALGDGTTDLRASPVAVVGLAGVVQLSAGGWHTCARLQDDTVRCWGKNEKGALGDGTTTQSLTPVRVAGLSDVAEVAAGDGFTCARRTDGSVWCWGYIFFDVLGEGAALATQIDALQGVVEIKAGYGHLCARRSDGTVLCLGPNTNGQLGDGSRTHRSTPVQVFELSDAAQISLGGHSCARHQSGRVSCWGSLHGQAEPRPVAVPGLNDAVEISTGGGHSCARLRDGTLRCWGYNSDGQTMAGGCCHDGLCGLPEGSACGAATVGGICTEGWCSGCGGEGQPCCDTARAPNRCKAANPLCNDQELCVACGGLNQPCCEGSTCADSGARCFNDRCMTPGEPEGPCLANNACNGGCCVLGDDVQPACIGAGTMCPGPQGSPAGACEASGGCGGCGALSQACCPVAQGTRIPYYCSAPNTECAGELCVSN